MRFVPGSFTLHCFLISPCRPPPPGGVIRVKGRNLTESEHIKLGAYHSLELEMGRAFTLHKVGRAGGGRH